jgi:hypothetical protein
MRPPTLSLNLSVSCLAKDGVNLGPVRHELDKAPKGLLAGCLDKRQPGISKADVVGEQDFPLGFTPKPRREALR